jgi:ABC-type phosphate/phosphonate transport system substrate-binding protein
MQFFARLIFSAFSLGLAFSANALVIGITEGVTYRASDAEIEAKFEGITKALGTATKLPVKVQIISSYNNLREALKSGQLDLAFIHPAHVAMEAIKGGNYRAVGWTTGFTEYKVSFLCKEPKPIDNWASVAGKSFVTPDADSITAVMTRAMLREHKVKTESVKLQTTRYQDAVPFYVENGFATYGATASAGVVKDWVSKGGKTCAESRGMPIKQWIASRKLDAATMTLIRNTLQGMDQTDAGRRALATSGYKGFIAPSIDLEETLMSWLGL